MKLQRDEPVIIELDDPPPRGARFIGVAVGILIFALVIAPFVLNYSTKSDETVIARTPPASHNQFCQPAFDLPSALDPVTSFAIPSWMRLCDWLSPPIEQPAERPPRT